MGKTYPRIEPRLQSFIEQQPVFFVATAPLAEDGHVNVSPKGRSGSLPSSIRTPWPTWTSAEATPRPWPTCARTAGSR